jgi:hypothetical protein
MQIFILNKMEVSVAHSQPMTLATNRSELSESSEPDAQSQPVPLAADCSEPSGLSGLHIQSQQELDKEIAADPALCSRQCGTSSLGNCMPWAWAKNGDLVLPSSDRIWADSFDTVDSWETYSQNCASQSNCTFIFSSFALPC